MDTMISMVRTHPSHIAAGGSYDITAAKVTGAEQLTRTGSFERALLQTMDQVSARQNNASDLIQEALVNPDAVAPHDITIAQGMANMSLNMTRNVLNRLVQGWRDLINTR